MRKAGLVCFVHAILKGFAGGRSASPPFEQAFSARAARMLEGVRPLRQRDERVDSSVPQRGRDASDGQPSASATPIDPFSKEPIKSTRTEILQASALVADALPSTACAREVDVTRPADHGICALPSLLARLEPHLTAAASATWRSRTFATSPSGASMSPHTAVSLARSGGLESSFFSRTPAPGRNTNRRRRCLHRLRESI
jgi:hypothetical protein